MSLKHILALTFVVTKIAKQLLLCHQSCQRTINVLCHYRDRILLGLSAIERQLTPQYTLQLQLPK